jgi:type IV secretion system protein VirB10
MTADATSAGGVPASTPPTTSIRAAPPKTRRLSRKTLMAGALVLGGLIAFALVNGMSDRPHRAVNDPDAQPTLQTVNPPESIREHPANYDLTQLQPPAEGHDFLWGDHPPPGAANAASAPAPASYAPPSSPSPLEAEADSARTSSILFGRNSGSAARPAGGGDRAATSGPHSGFVNAQGARDDGALDATYLPPRSPYTVQSGSTISAALITALNSDQPGRVIAQVSENVFDSVTGQQLLIPQGARLIGTYDADTAYGEQRLLIVWNRLIMPNGWSIALRGMPGTDALGASGLHGDVDAHLGGIAVASLISGVLGVSANESQDDNSGRFAQSVGDAAAQQAAQTGSRIVDRELSVRPTVRVQAGARVRVLISQDLILRPYHP